MLFRSTDLISSETLTQKAGKTTTVTEGEAVLFEICNRAKDEGIVIYTIGFELTAGSRGGRALQECASGDNNFFPVDALNLADAFEAIAADILNLKLTN